MTMRPAFSSAARMRPTLAACLALAALLLMPLGRAEAQELVLSVNGDPITSVDVAERMKLLRAFRKPASREAAIESMISDRLKEREAGKFGVFVKDEEIGEEVQLEAKRLKMSAQALSAAVARSGVSAEHARNHFKAELAYGLLVRALNRGVEASEVAVRAELAKEKGSSKIISYSIRQVVFTLDPSAGAPALEAGVKEANALRTRFTSCESGIPYAKSLPGVAVREKLTRSSTQLGDEIKEVLDKTPIGHLTQPSRSANGIEMIAVCNRSAEANDDELRKEISERILAQHIEAQEAEKYKELRSTAVIDRPRG